MKITVITVGKIKEKYLEDAIAEYSKRLSRYCKLEIIQVADEKTPDRASEVVETQIKDKEGERILSHIKDTAYVVAPCHRRQNDFLRGTGGTDRWSGSPGREPHSVCDWRFPGPVEKSAGAG